MRGAGVVASADGLVEVVLADLAGFTVGVGCAGDGVSGVGRVDENGEGVGFSIDAALAREAVAIVGLDAAVAAAAACGCAGVVARGVRRADNQSIVAINPILAVFCRV